MAGVALQKAYTILNDDSMAKAAETGDAQARVAIETALARAQGLIEVSKVAASMAMVEAQALASRRQA